VLSQEFKNKEDFKKREIFTKQVEIQKLQEEEEKKQANLKVKCHCCCRFSKKKNNIKQDGSVNNQDQTVEEPLTNDEIRSEIYT
jgi:hypothetical protein